MTNRIIQLFEQKKNDILNVYFTAGFPQLEDTRLILQTLADAGADIIEIGMPYSDPVADGPTIQASNDKSLENGMSLKKLFEQLEGIRQYTQVPILLMGYLNPVVQYGVERFCEKCQEIGVDGLILPDLPMYEYLDSYKSVFEKNNLLNIFLITPQTSESRIRQIDEVSKGFIYMVSSASITGAKSGIAEEQEVYFKRVQQMKLANPTLIGFGISNHSSFTKACQYANGAIIGSAFIKVLEQSNDLKTDITDFVQGIKGIPITA
ncbi:tryptophan synthase subunit alpha [Cytophagaceae bacterium DM2B3-1]|uniref:Tryptophan synthase alpha chain n=1 Tax=Xanthocytophaga flava TaxID=3048013 RepID=A0ABT7CVV6_9BACT|nr:tryptophan synthase subunit alpha [Xanthocytophaga flavus]MDJ1497908.1 tryptophan synthase subunit alpha [Xanthocytophaga flavus]